MKKYIANDRKMKKMSAAGWIAVGAVWLAIWQGAAMAASNGLLLPGPWAALSAMKNLSVTPKFYADICWTVGRCLIAMALSFGAGAVLAWCAYRQNPVRQLLSLPVAFFKAVPVMAIIIYVVLLAKSDWVGVIVCFFMCFPIVYTNILSGLDNMPAEYLELAQVCGLTKSKVLKLIFIPGVLPQIKASISLIAGLSWKAVVAAEVLSVPQFSLGYEMINAKYYLETDKLFAYIIVIVALSLVFEKIIKTLAAGLEWRPYEGSRVWKREKYGAAGRISPIDDVYCCRPPKIEILNLKKSYGENQVFSGYSEVFQAGGVTAVMAPSGSGKTTLVRIIAGLEKSDGEPKCGQVSADTPYRSAYLFQEDRLIPWLNIYDNMAISMEAADDARLRQMAEALEISETLAMLPTQLSGGMRHRAALGRTFLSDGNLLILDEPFKGLDSELKERLISRLWAAETCGKTVIMVTHVQKDAEALADRVVYL